MSFTEVTDEGVKAVAARCPLLTVLDVEDTKITDKGRRAVTAACPSILILHS